LIWIKVEPLNARRHGFGAARIARSRCALLERCRSAHSRLEKALQIVSTIRDIRQRRYLGWIISLAALGACLMLRVYIHSYGDFLGSAAFMPAVMIAGLFGGVAAGIAVFLASIFVLFFFFVPPYLIFEIDSSRDGVGLSMFIVTAGLALYLIRTLNKAVDISHALAEQALLMQRRTAILFAELQHRVANNLTFLTAIIDLQIKQTGRETRIAVALEAVRNRLVAMSRRHRRLYDPARVDAPFGQYLGELFSEQIAMCGAPVTHTITCDDVVLGLDQLVPLALIRFGTHDQLPKARLQRTISRPYRHQSPAVPRGKAVRVRRLR